jgi:hypothetical protein
VLDVLHISLVVGAQGARANGPNLLGFTQESIT